MNTARQLSHVRDLSMPSTHSTGVAVSLQVWVCLEDLISVYMRASRIVSSSHSRSGRPPDSFHVPHSPLIYALDITPQARMMLSVYPSTPLNESLYPV